MSGIRARRRRGQPARGETTFVGRENKLEFLNEKYASPRAGFVVLYGNARTGKTELLKRFYEGKRHVLYACRPISGKEQLDAFRHAFALGVFTDGVREEAQRDPRVHLTEIADVLSPQTVKDPFPGAVDLCLTESHGTAEK